MTPPQLVALGIFGIIQMLNCYNLMYHAHINFNGSDAFIDPENSEISILEKINGLVVSRMKIKLLSIITFYNLILVPQVTFAQGMIWYVSTTGLDGNVGSEENPFPTIQQGIDASSDGDTVLIQVGYYDRENINYNGKNIVLGSHYLTTGEATPYVAHTIIGGVVGESEPLVRFGNYSQGIGVNRDAKLSGLTTFDNGVYGVFCTDFDNPAIEKVAFRRNSKGTSN